MLGFVIFPRFIMDAVLMPDLRDDFNLHIFTDRTAALSGTRFSLGGLFGYFPIAVGMVCHIELFTAGAFLPVLGFVIFPCFIVNIVRMNRNRLFLRIFADGAGTFSGTCFGCGRLLCYRPITESMVAHFSFLAAAAFLPVLGFILLPVAVAVLMFKHWNGFGLHIVADRAVTLSGTSLGFGGRLRLSPIAVDMVCHIQLFTTGTLLPVISIIIFPCFIVNIVRMNRQRLFLRIFADGAGTFSGTCFGCGRLLCYRPITESMVGYSILINFFAVVAYLPVCSRTATPVVGIVMLVFSVSINLLIAAGKAPPFTYVILRIYIIIDQLPFAEVMGALFRFLSAAAFFPMLGSIIFPAAEAVFMGGSRPLSAAGIAADCPVAPGVSLPYGIIAVRIAGKVNLSGPYFKRIRILRLSDILRIEKYPPVYLNAFCLEYLTVQYQLRLILKIRAA